MATKRPDLAVDVNETFDTANHIETYGGYIAPLRRWMEFCMELQIDPLTFPYEVEVVIYWIMDEIKRFDSIASIKRWEASIGWLGDMLGYDNIHWRFNPRYKSFRKAAMKRWFIPPTQKLPITIEHLLAMARKFNIRQSTLYEISFDLLVQWTAIVWLFLTFSRPAEVLRRTQKRTDFGLNISDVQTITLIEGDRKTLRIRVDRFKNAISRKCVKTIYVRDTECEKPHCTRCDPLNPLHLYRIMMHRRAKLARRAPRGSALHKRLSTSNGDNALFVLHNGRAVTRTIIQRGVDRAISASGMRQSRQYTPYSLRIGATTQAHRIKLCHAKILQYVGWKLNSLPDMAYRYTRYPPQSLQWMAYEMVHGTTAGVADRGSNTLFDPWVNYRQWRTDRH